MQRLLDSIAGLVALLPPERVETIAARVRQSRASNVTNSLRSAVGTPVAEAIVDELIEAWRTSSVTPSELASMLTAAAHVYRKVKDEQSLELVWTGPTTPFVSARRTEQALLQVINAAKKSLFITSFVAYEVPSVVRALNEAAGTGVHISMLLESSQDHGGSITVDAIGKMRALVPTARLYAWREKAEGFGDGRVHAKVAVADGRACFITSANLTGFAMERNMEAGVLITGGSLPALLDDHLRALVDTRVVSAV